VACNSDQLGAQGRVNALCEGGAYGAAAALAGGEADAYVVVDGEAHATGDEATIAVRPCPSVTLLEDHNSGESSCHPLVGNTLANRIVNRALHRPRVSRRVAP
jgi:hypothetical protein